MYAPTNVFVIYQIGGIFSNFLKSSKHDIKLLRIMYIFKVNPYEKGGKSGVAVTLMSAGVKTVAIMSQKQWKNWTKGLSFDEAAGLPCDIAYKQIGDVLVDGSKVRDNNVIVDDFTVFTNSKGAVFHATVEAQIRLANLGSVSSVPIAQKSAYDEFMKDYQNATTTEAKEEVYRDAQTELTGTDLERFNAQVEPGLVALGVTL